MDQTTICAPQYSGTQSSGLNKNASYDRIYYTGSVGSIECVSKIIDELTKVFAASCQTRAVCKLTIPSSLKNSLNGLKDPSVVESVFDYNPGTIHANKSDLMIGINKVSRSLDDSTVNEIKGHVKADEKLIDCNSSKIKEKQIKSLELLMKQGFSFKVGKDIETDKLFPLWSQSFVWTIERIENEIKNPETTIVALYDNCNNLVSAAMISKDGESTEWRTDNGSHGNGYIQSVLTVLNSLYIRNNKESPKTITTEARYDKSVRPGLKVGFKLSTELNNMPSLLKNHVTIDNEAPDEWNEGKSSINNVDISHLRSFCVMYLDQDMYDSDYVAAVLKEVNL